LNWEKTSFFILMQKIIILSF